MNEIERWIWRGDTFRALKAAAKSADLSSLRRAMPLKAFHQAMCHAYFYALSRVESLMDATVKQEAELLFWAEVCEYEEMRASGPQPVDA